MKSIQFPRSDVRTSALGVGVATLMREPSPSRQQRLLRTAYDLGFRHFDVAPSYGLGAAESALGRFLREGTSDVTLATKVGIRARGNFLTRALQRPIRTTLRVFPGLRGRATAAVGNFVHARPDFALLACTRSLEQSLRNLRRDAVDLLLLHEARLEDLRDGATLDWLETQRQRGLTRSIGVATTPDAAEQIVALFGNRLDVIQSPSHVLAPAPSVLRNSGLFRITHGAIAAPLGYIERRRAVDGAWAGELSRLIDRDVSSAGPIAQLLLACAATENADGIILIGTSKADHLAVAASSMGAYTETQVSAARDFLRQTLMPQPMLNASIESR